MKPIHWTLLALCLAGCRSTRGGADPPLAAGPGSRVVAAPPTPPRVEPIDAPEFPAAPVSGEATPREDVVGAPIVDEPREAEESPPTIESEPAVSEPAPPSTAVEPVADDPETREIRARAAKAIAEGDDALAFELFEVLRARPSLAKARELIAAGRPREALAELELALKDDADRPELLEAKGQVCLVLADTGEIAFYEPARAAFELAGAAPTALLGQSRAARKLGRTEEALDCARRAMLLLSVRPAERLSLDPSAEVVLADAGLDRLPALRAAGGNAASVLQSEIEAALKARIAALGIDAAAHLRLTTLYLEGGKPELALAAAARGLDSSPGNADLTRALARAALSAGGPDRLLDAFAQLRQKFPRQALAHWFPALERFKSLVANKPAGSAAPRNQIAEAELGFQRCRELDPRYDADCRQYEVLCRGWLGWFELEKRNYGRARSHFLSMNEPLPGGIALRPGSVDPQWEGRLLDGATGMAKLAERHRVLRQEDVAADVLADLHAALPRDVGWARAAAEGAYEAAEAQVEAAAEFERARGGLQTDAKELAALRRSAGVKDREVGSSKEGERFAQAAARKRELAAEYYRRSWGHYLAAVALAPEDVRLACDAARIEIYHVRSDPARAEELLRRAIAHAQRQDQDPSLDESARESLRGAWGDALQFQGVLEMETNHDPEAAIASLQAALLIDPIPRSHIRDVLLPQAREASNRLAPEAPSEPRKPR